MKPLARLAAAAAAIFAAAMPAHADVDGARKEGQVNVYSSLTARELGTVAAAFEKKYGVKVNYWRAGSEKILQRALTESRSGRHEMDVMETNGPELEAAAREKLFVPVTSIHEKDLLAAAVRPDRSWTGLRLNMFVQAYNTNLVKKQDLPKSYQDLADPKWKGKLAIEAEDIDWFGAVVNGIGEVPGLKLFRDVARTNGIGVRKGHTLLAGLVASGEVPLALTVYSHGAEKLKKDGAPIDWFTIEPAYARVNGIAVAKSAPHPNAARLFFDFMLGPEGQAILQKGEYIPANLTLRDPNTRSDLRFIDPRIVLDEQEKWARLFDEIITKQGRRE